MPTRPSPSPTTVSAAKPMIRPPLTTLVTRLIAIIFSRMPSSGLSLCIFACIFAMIVPLELQTGFTRGICQRLHTAVVTETGAVERDFGDSCLQCFFSNALANQGCSGGIATLARFAGQLRANFCFHGRRRNQNFSVRADQVRVNVQVSAVDRQAVHFQLRDLDAGLTSAAQTRFFFVHRQPLITSSWFL